MWNFGGGGVYTCIVIAEKYCVYVFVNERQRGEKGRVEGIVEVRANGQDDGRMKGKNGSRMASKEREERLGVRDWHVKLRRPDIEY